MEDWLNSDIAEETGNENQNEVEKDLVLEEVS